MYSSQADISKKLYELMGVSNSAHFRDPIRLCQRFGIVLFALIWLCSCQFLLESQVPVDVEISKTYQGRIAFRSPSESFVTVFRWLETSSNFQLTLRDRLALGGIRINGNESTAQIEYSNGTTVENVDLDQWIEENLGLAVPFRELWKCLSLTCKLIDEAEQKNHDQHGRLETFFNDQWSFTFSYRDENPDSSILKELEMRKDETTVRIFFTKFEN